MAVQKSRKTPSRRGMRRSHDKLIESVLAVSLSCERRKTPSRRGMRRSHDKLTASTLSIEPTTGETHRRHHVSADGFYKGRKVIDTPVVEFDEEE